MSLILDSVFIFGIIFISSRVLPELQYLLLCKLWSPSLVLFCFSAI